MTSSTTPRLRCAIYTRKSTEEGLEQEFNSLDAQREACSAFIASQASLGWRLVPDRYDDGGISGGTMERPALQRLLQDIRDRKVDVVVVYKIDRLTRSLMDFSRIVEIFDGHGVSFVSVTQQFNTTTSMGRLTLNVLLSFAQFEREVTAERIRDKIAASKKKGMWMGGRLPLGYEVRNRKLIVNEAEAATVRHLFTRYLELRSVRALSDEATATGLKGRVPAAEHASSAFRSGKPFGRGNLYHLLSNPIYIGSIRHRDQVHPGEHQRIIEDNLFHQVQALLAAGAPKRSTSSNKADTHLLTGLVFDETGDRLSPVHATKAGKRYRYYVSKRLMVARKKDQQGWRIPARELERIVEQQLMEVLRDEALLADWIQAGRPDMHALPVMLRRAGDVAAGLPDRTTSERNALFQQIFSRITIRRDWIRFELNRSALVDWIAPEDHSASESFPSCAVAEAAYTIERPIGMKRRGVEARLVLGNGTARHRSPDQGLIDLLARAQLYLDRLTTGAATSIGEVAWQLGIDPVEVSRILPLAFLAPKLVDSIVAGTQPVELTLQRLARISDLPLSWAAQAGSLQS